jgi:hypothetical protein
VLDAMPGLGDTSLRPHDDASSDRHVVYAGRLTTRRSPLTEQRNSFSVNLSALGIPAAST